MPVDGMGSRARRRSRERLRRSRGCHAASRLGARPEAREHLPGGRVRAGCRARCARGPCAQAEPAVLLDPGLGSPAAARPRDAKRRRSRARHDRRCFGGRSRAMAVATRRAPTDEERAALDLAWRVCRHVKSNAIVLARGTAVVGVGAGQMSRVDSARLAVEKAGAERARGAVCASDAFYPFPDALEVCAAAGVTAFVQPGGSQRDAEVVCRGRCSRCNDAHDTCSSLPSLDTFRALR